VLGALLGSYRVVELIAEGSLGAVYIGRHETLGRRVVMKVLLPELSHYTDMVQRFFHEAQTATAIRNAGIVQVIDFGTSYGCSYLVMELLEGETLAARLKQRRLEPAECCRIGRQVANVMQAAHIAGITHRDLKPENLFLVHDPEVIGGERVKVLDFGIAKLASDAHASGVRTRTGLLMGSPIYMSPEQCRSFRISDARSDIYSLGCILFEIACGHPPFSGEGMGDLIGAHLHTPPPHPQQLEPSLPHALSALIVKMLSKHPDARPQTMAEVSGSLDEILRTLGPPPRAPSSPPVRAETAPPVRAETAPPVPSSPTLPSPRPAKPSPSPVPQTLPLPPARPPTRSPAPLPPPEPSACPTPPLPLPPKLPPSAPDLTLPDSVQPEPTLADPTLLPESYAMSPPVPSLVASLARLGTPLPIPSRLPLSTPDLTLADSTLCDSGLPEFPRADDETLRAGMVMAHRLGVPRRKHRHLFHELQG